MIRESLIRGYWTTVGVLLAILQVVVFVFIGALIGVWFY